MYALFQTQGTRDYMEDFVDIEENFVEFNNSPLDFYAIYDGHGGSKVAQYLALTLKNNIKKRILQNVDIKTAIYIGCDDTARSITNNDCGSTALIIIKSKTHIWAANTGDCRAVLKVFRDFEYQGLPLTEDHKPNTDTERNRIESLGGYIQQDMYGTWRVKGSLAVSRSFGDLYLHPYVIWHPDVTVLPINETMRAIIMASDGVWDVLSNQDVVDIAKITIRQSPSFDKEKILNNIVKNINITARERGSGDNISVVFIMF